MVMKYHHSAELPFFVCVVVCPYIPRFHSQESSTLSNLISVLRIQKISMGLLLVNQ